MSKESDWPSNRFHLSAPNALNAVPVVQAFIRSCAITMGFQEPELTHLEIVAEELSANILQHAYAAGEAVSFSVECVQEPGQLEMVFRDQGRPFDPELLPDFTGVDPDTLDAPPGLGQYLAARLVDVFQARNLGGRGKEIRLLKRLRGSWQPPAEQPDFRHTTALPSAEDFAAVQVRPMQPAEAVEVSRLIYDAYRYTYMSDVPYYPDRLRRLQAEGQLHSFVAVLGNGMVASHVALLRSPEMPTLAEIGLAATRQEARGHGLAEKVGMAALQAAVEQLGLAGIYVNFTTAHTSSQRVNRRGLGIAVGLLPARSPETVEFKGITDQVPQRISTLLVFQTLAERAPVTLYVPEAHRDFIADLYERCELPAELDVTEAPLLEALSEIELLEALSEIEMVVERERNLAQLSVRVAGHDLLAQVKERLFGLHLNKTPVVFCFLNLFDPHTPTVAATLQQVGFFFTGVLPGGMREGDALLMACLLGCAVDYDRIELAEKDSRALLDYVRQQDPHYQAAPTA
jgi:serine/threonine-protein kinase RsbW